MVSRQLHDKRSRITGEVLRLLQDNARTHNDNDAEHIAAECIAPVIIHDVAGDQGNDRKLRSARHVGGRNHRHPAVLLVFNRTGRHDTRNTASA